MKQQVMFKIAQRIWIPCVVVAVAVSGGIVIKRMHGIFGSEQTPTSRAGAEQIVSTIPKYVLYEVYGPPETSGMISYLDENAQPQEGQFTSLPWSLTVKTTVPSVFANIVAQGNSTSLGCKISINGVLREQQAANAVNATTFCLVKAA